MRRFTKTLDGVNSHIHVGGVARTRAGDRLGEILLELPQLAGRKKGCRGLDLHVLRTLRLLRWGLIA